MPVVTELTTYKDDAGNEIVYPGHVTERIKINFRGSNNRVVVDADARLGRLVVDFDCDNGTLQIGASKGVPAFQAAIRIGQDATVTIGENVSVTEQVAMSACEGTSITVGPDVMFASENQVRADDGHPIFDVCTGKRINVSRSIDIGAHVWLGRGAVVLGGTRIGSGSVIGYGSVVKGKIPNNAVAVGVPARVARRDVAWERPHLSLTRPFYKPDASTVTKSKYWKLTADDAEIGQQPDWRKRARRVAGAAKRRAVRLRDRVKR